MKYFTLASFIISSATIISCNPKATQDIANAVPTDVVLEDRLDSVSYAIGIDFAKNVKQIGMDTVKYDALQKGIMDGYKSDELEIDQEKFNEVIKEYIMELEEKKYGHLKEESIAFMAKNATEKGVISLPSGLQYKVITAGSGEKPTATSTVKTHYHGTFTDGTVFDSSVERGEPISFPVNGVIAGWTEALQLMPVGSKWILYVPYDLAYGEHGTPGIEPYSTLIFEVELLSIEQ